jgi:hypothetical protein
MCVIPANQSHKNRILQLHDLDIGDEIFLVIATAVQVFELKPIEY